MAERTEAQKAHARKLNAAGVARSRAAKRYREERGLQRTGERDAYGVPVLSRSEELERGIISVKDLSDDELANRKCLNASGTFTGVRFQHSPKTLAAMDAELLERGARLLRSGYTRGITRLLGMIDHTDARVALQAVDRVMERVAGKVPDKLLSADVTPYADAHSEIAAELAKALGYSVPSPAPEEPNVIVGEVVEDEPEERPKAAEPQTPARPARRKPKTARKSGAGGAIDVSKYV